MCTYMPCDHYVTFHLLFNAQHRLGGVRFLGRVPIDQKVGGVSLLLPLVTSSSTLEATMPARNVTMATFSCSILVSSVYWLIHVYLLVYYSVYLYSTLVSILLSIFPTTLVYYYSVYCSTMVSILLSIFPTTLHVSILLLSILLNNG